MIALIEPECVGSSHEEANAAVIYSFCKAVYPEKVVLFADIEHINCIKRILNRQQKEFSNLIFQTVKIPKPSLLKIRVFFSFFMLIFRLLLFCKENKIKKIVFLSINSNNLIVLKTLLHFFKTENFHIRIIIHGVLEDILRPVPLLLWKKINSIYYAISLFDYLEIKYFVLSDNILQEILNLFPHLQTKFFSFEFSYLYISDLNVKKKASTKIIFSTIGQGNPTIMRYLASELDRLGPYNHEYELRIIGKNIEDVKPMHKRIIVIIRYFYNFLKYFNKKFVLVLEKNSTIHKIIYQPMLEEFKCVNCVSKGKWITRDEIEFFIKEVDYVLFVYEKDTYKLTVSGSFFDSISYKKPIIALSNIFFNNIFSNYNLGYLVTTPREMVSQMIQILNKKENDYKLFLSEIERFQHEKNIENEIIKLKQ